MDLAAALKDWDALDMDEGMEPETTIVEAARSTLMDIATKVATAEKIRVLRDTAELISPKRFTTAGDAAERELAQSLLREWADILEAELGVEQDTEHITIREPTPEPEPEPWTGGGNWLDQ